MENNAPKKPTIDERIEAIAQSLELTASMLRDLEIQVAKIAVAQEKNDHRMGQLMETMNRLGNIVIAHEERIEHLEGQ